MIAIGGKIWFMIVNLQLVLSSTLHQDLEQFEYLENIYIAAMMSLLQIGNFVFNQ